MKRQTVSLLVASLLLIGGSGAFGQTPPPGCDVPEPGEMYVFTRTPRHVDPIGQAIDGSNWQHFSDVGRTHAFAESEVAIKHPYGRIETIHKEKGCAAHEAKVSPDGQRIAYAVSCGTERKLNYAGVVGALTEIDTSRGTSTLWVYDLKSGKKTQVTNRHYDRQPEWCGNDCLVFPSDRAGTYAPLAYNGVRYPNKAWQIHKGYLRGGKLVDIHNINHHALNATSPSVTSRGEILYSCWQGHGPEVKPSPSNYWNVCAMDLNGANGRVVLGAHWLPNPRAGFDLKRVKGDWTGGQNDTGRLALRPAAEVSKGRLCSGSYYRGNGPGEILCWSDIEVEGAHLLRNIINAVGTSDKPGSGLFVPSDIEPATPYAQAFDLNWPRKNSKGEYGGRTSHPAVGPGGMLFTWGWPFCYEGIQGEAMKKLSCDRDIMRAKKPVVVDPWTDAECIVCDPNFQDLDAQWIAPFEKRYGVAFPTVEPLEGDKCFMVVDDARQHELYDIPAFEERIAAVQWTPYTLHKTLPNQQGLGIAGEPITFMLPRDVEGAVTSGAVVQEVPCETPLLNNGVDKSGAAFAHDPMLHSLRPGETRRCKGCHAGHSVEWEG